MVYAIDQDILEKVIKLRHELHRHPELSMKENRTKMHLMEFLQKETDLKIVDHGRWFVVLYQKEGSSKHLAFRADFDAVPVNEAGGFVPYCSENPGVAHKCGHDGHSAALAAFAMMLSRYGANCNVCLLFQHAEETGQGAAECLPFLEEYKIDEIYAVHNMPGLKRGTVSVSEGVVQYASTGMTLSFHGKRSHACYPEDGINPSYAISEMILGMESLRAAQGYQGLTLVTIIGVRIGEHAFGTSAGEGELLLTVRGEHEAELTDLTDKIEKLAEEKCRQYCLTCSVQYEDQFADCFNHKESVENVQKAAIRAGFELHDLAEPFRASEDFGRFTKVVPGAIFYIGSGEDHAPLHTPEYDFPDEILSTIAGMYLAIAGNAGMEDSRDDNGEV